MGGSLERDPRVSPNSNSKICRGPAPDTADFSVLRDAGGERPANTGLFCLNRLWAARTRPRAAAGSRVGTTAGRERGRGAQATASRPGPPEGGREAKSPKYPGAGRWTPHSATPPCRTLEFSNKEGRKRPERLRFPFRTKTLANAWKHWRSNERCDFKTF